MIPDPDAPTGLSPLFSPPLSSTGTANVQQLEMLIQVLLAMDQDSLSKEEEGVLMGQRVHEVLMIPDPDAPTGLFPLFPPPLGHSK